MNEKIYKRLLELIEESMPEVDVSGAGMDTRFIEDLRYDSLGLMTLVMNVEKEFSVAFNTFYQINTIKDIYDFIVNKMGIK